jgi:uncharacterized membrane protein
MTKSRNWWNRLISTLWFVPTLFVGGGILLALCLVAIDQYVGSPLDALPSFFSVQSSGARDILAVIAGSSITLAGTVFSITIIALTLASTQFSPRILRNFMRDPGNQAVLGVLVGIFAYSIVVLRTIRDGSDLSSSAFVPSTAIFFAVIFALIGVGSLVYFIHHVAISIQATSIISAIANETISEIQKSFPKSEQSPKPSAQTSKILGQEPSYSVAAEVSGYVQNIDTKQLIDLAEKHQVVVKMQRRVGQFTIEGLPILELFSKNSELNFDAATISRFDETYDIGTFRTISGDVAFGLRQIVDIALKALSPAVNDSTTAITCVDYLTAVMLCIAKRPSCPSYLYKNNELRVVFEVQRFEDFFDLSFNQIRQNAGGNVAVILRQLNSVNILSKANVSLQFKDERSERHLIMQSQAKLLFELAQKTIVAADDLQTVSRYYQRVEKSLKERNSKIKL